MSLLGHLRTATRPKCWRRTTGLSPHCSCDTSNIIWKPFTWIVRRIIFYPVPAPKVKLKSPIFAWGQQIHTRVRTQWFWFLYSKEWSLLSEFVLCFLSVTEVFTALTNRPRGGGQWPRSGFSHCAWNQC